MATNVIVQNGAKIVMDAGKASSTDVCPVCKTTLQSTPSMRFKVSSRCYHRICEGCVDRFYSSGKAQCPVAGCDKQLWRRDWTIQTFEDTQVMREMDLRKRVFGVLELSKLGLTESSNGWEDAFEDLRAYNDYLEMKEELAMNLIYKTDVASTNKRLKEYQSANGMNTDEDGKPQTRPAAKTGDYPDRSGLIKGLKRQYIPKARSPYDPFTGITKDRGYYNAEDRYTISFDKEKNYPYHEVAGYSFDAYMDESLLRAFAGLGVFIEKEKGGKTDMAMSLSAQPPQPKAVDDVF